MWKLTIEDDEGQRTSLDLELDEYTIGRSEDNDIRLTERNISRRHCIVRQADEAWELLDEGSYNGTYVNGERVTDEGRDLKPGDVINIGDYRIELEDASASKPEEPARKRRPDRLICVIGPNPGMEYSLQGDRLTLGRAEDAAICINHASVSRLHAELHNLGQSRWEVVDQGSSNGIRINGVELRRGIIEPGDAFELGDVRLRFVAAGKFYRPVVDMSQQLPAMPFEGMAGPAGVPSSDRKPLTIAAVLFGVLAIGVGAWVMFSKPPEPTTDPGRPMASTDAAAETYLKQAREYLESKDFQKAHNILQSIPEDSPVRESAEYTEIEDAWADSMFDKAAATDDPDEKVALLNTISETTTVSPSKRQRAADMALEISPEKAKPVAPYPRPVVPRPVPVIDNPYGDDNGTKKPGPKSTGGKEPAPKPASNPAKAGLMAKMQSGSASCDELRMLKALCMTDNDTACRNAAYGAWKAKCNK